MLYLDPKKCLSGGVVEFREDEQKKCVHRVTMGSALHVHMSHPHMMPGQAKWGLQLIKYLTK